MAKIDLTTLGSGYNSTANLNDNFQAIEDEFNNKVLYRDNPAGEANAMQNDFDMNSNRILNLPSGTTASEPATYGQLLAAASGITSITTLSEEQNPSSNGQALFTFSGISYTPGAKNLIIYRNGVKVPRSFYTETSTTSVTLNASLAALVVTDDAFEFEVNQRDVDSDTYLASNVTYTPSGTGAVATDVQTQLREQGVYVTRFGADKSGTTDSTAAITAAWTAASATLDAETIVYWPAGTYLVTQLDYTGINSVRNVALGTVVILGTDNTSTYSFIVGCDGYNAGTPASSTFTRRHHWDGRFIINPQDTGRTYTTGMRLYAAVECYMTDCSVAGNFATNTVDLQYSFTNRWTGGSIGNSNDGSGGTVYGLECQNNNVNVNVFTNIRFSGTNDTTESQVLIRLQGRGNTVSGCDISAAREGVRVDASISSMLLNNYFEGCLYPITCGNESAAVARGVSVTGGWMEVLTNGTGITTGVGSYGCQGFSISGVAFEGISAGSSRTAVDLGSQSYHVTIDAPDYRNIDTDITGTVNAGGGIGDRLFGGALQVSPSGGLSTFESTTMGNTSVTGGFQYMSFEGFGTIGFYIASGTPEGNITAGVGSVCLRSNGGAGTTLYVKESGTGNTGWVGK